MKNKILFSFLAAVSWINLASAALVPQEWIKDVGPTYEKSMNEDLNGLERDYDNLLDAKSTMLEKLAQEKSVKNGKRKWFLQSVKSELGIEPVGKIGIVGVKGEAAVEMIWVRTQESINKLQNKYYGPYRNNIESEEVSAGPKVDETVRLTSKMTQADFEKQIGPIVEASIRTGKVKNRQAFQRNLIQKMKEFQNMAIELERKPQERPWWPYKFQLALYAEASGKVLPYMSVGTGIRILLEWYRIEKEVADPDDYLVKQNDRPLSQNAKFIYAMAKDFETLDELNVRSYKYGLDYIKVGVGLGVKGNIFVAKAKGGVIGSVFFKRDALGSQNKSVSLKEPKLDDHFYIAAEDNSKNREYAYKHKLNVTPLSGTEKSFGEDQQLALYKASREHFRNGLHKTIKMARFLSKGAVRRAERLRRKGKMVHFDLKVLELELELYLRGGVGAVTLEGIGILELFLVKR
ncbi:MAG: hypothetical protein VYD54_07260 [Bdellovibrionota bacterium]|nr:hypothetical protein [Bdellovibrionota bacterium]